MVEWRKILCPVDFSQTSRRALGVAADLAHQFGAELMLLHVYQAPAVSFPGIEIDDMGPTSRIVGASAIEDRDVGPSEDPEEDEDDEVP